MINHVGPTVRPASGLQKSYLRHAPGRTLTTAWALAAVCIYRIIILRGSRAAHLGTVHTTRDARPRPAWQGCVSVKATPTTNAGHARGRRGAGVSRLSVHASGPAGVAPVECTRACTHQLHHAHTRSRCAILPRAREQRWQTSRWWPGRPPCPPLVPWPTCRSGPPP